MLHAVWGVVETMHHEHDNDDGVSGGSCTLVHRFHSVILSSLQRDYSYLFYPLPLGPRWEPLHGATPCGGPNGVGDLWDWYWHSTAFKNSVLSLVSFHVVVVVETI